MELAGVILAAVPIVMDAFDHYGQVFAAISRFRHYAVEVVKLDVRLRTQRAIFRNSSANLCNSINSYLEGSRGHDAMHRHSSVSRFQESLESCKMSLDQIQSALHTITGWVARFHDVFPEDDTKVKERIMHF